MSLNRKARRQFEKNGSSSRSKVVGVATAGSVLATQASLLSPAAAVSSQVVTSCADSGTGSLRAAITSANAAPDLTKVTFRVPSSCTTITLSAALPVIAAPLNIQGPGANKLAIGGTAFTMYDVIFDANEHATSLNVSGLTLKGAGIRHAGNGASSLMTDVIDGLVVKQANVVDRIFDFQGDIGSSVTIENSTFTDNHSDGENGIHWMLVNARSNLTFKNNTVVNNSFAESMITSSGTEAAFVQSNTIVTNDTGAAGWSDMTFYGVSLFGNLIANLDSTGAEVCAYVNDQGANLYSSVDHLNGCSTSALPTGVQSDGKSAIISDYSTLGLVSSLALNGGTTPSLAVRAGSPALNYYQANDSGVHGTLATTDQRGLARPSGSGYDVGAFELQAGPVCKPARLGAVQFNKNSAKLTESGKKTLDAYVNSIAASGCRTVTLNGYSAAVGGTTKSTTKFRKNLSYKRATAVEKYLKSGSAAKNVTASFVSHGLGTKNPAATNKRESGRKQNRRVDVIISKLRALN
jgi:outer membrane protein OmpA-like peptidoglycan-associated protein